MTRAPEADVQRLLVVLPNWVGDLVMATPVLAALRSRFRGAHIAFLMRQHLRDVVAGGGWHDGEWYWPGQRGLVRLMRTRDLARRLREERFDTAVLLPNAFRAGLVARLAEIPRRVGYARECRGPLLTDRLVPARENGRFTPTPMVHYYAALAERLGCPVTDRRLRLEVTPEQERHGRELQRHYDLERGTYAVVNPGAAFGAAKCWLPERFAAACDRLVQEQGLRPVLIGAPAERSLLEMIAERATCCPVRCFDPGTTLGSLKVMIRDAALLVCNDSGPRHYGIAFGVPTVSIFGPTDQRWTTPVYDREVALQAAVECGPCQLRACPLDHRCMERVTVEAVLAGASRLLANGDREGHGP